MTQRSTMQDKKNKEVVTLPELAEMKARLVRFDNSPALLSGLYPLICKSAGREFFTEAVVLMVLLAMRDTTLGQSIDDSQALADRAPQFVAVITKNQKITVI